MKKEACGNLEPWGAGQGGLRSLLQKSVFLKSQRSEEPKNRATDKANRRGGRQGKNGVNRGRGNLGKKWCRKELSPSTRERLALTRNKGEGEGTDIAEGKERVRGRKESRRRSQFRNSN